jgi:hypothetical protein
MRKRGKERKVTKKRRIPRPEALSSKQLNNGEGTEGSHQNPQSDTWLS